MQFKNLWPLVGLCLFLFGCYEETVREAASKLKIGMTKAEFTLVTKDLKFLKEQTVLMYPNSNENEMRATLTHDQHYELREPANLVDLLTFDGNMKVYSYLIRKKKIYANPPLVDHLSVFYDQKEDKVIGWGHLRTSGDIDSWRDKF